jgi:hypothetical protein
MQELCKESDRIHEICRVFGEGLCFYRRQKWAAAEKYFSFLKEKFQDASSEVFLRRIALFKLDPPARTGTGSQSDIGVGALGSVPGKHVEE